MFAGTRDVGNWLEVGLGHGLGDFAAADSLDAQELVAHAPADRDDALGELVDSPDVVAAQRAARREGGG